MYFCRLNAYNKFNDILVYMLTETDRETVCVYIMAFVHLCMPRKKHIDYIEKQSRMYTVVHTFANTHMHTRANKHTHGYAYIAFFS